MIARQTAVQTAISMKGQRRQVVDLYNTVRPLPLGYRVKYEDLLCATYISSIFIRLGWTDIVPPNPRAWQLYEIMAAIDCGVHDKNRTPQIGDLIFFGNGEEIRHINHVGIVTEVIGQQIYYYDIQNTVGRHTCPVGYSYIWGYGIPDYASKDLEPLPEPEPEPEPDVPRKLKVGDLVTVNPGAKWYKGQSIKLNVFSDIWYVMSIKGDRVVLGMNKDETRNIQSPIHDTDVTLYQEAAVPDVSGRKIKLSVEVDYETYQLIDIMAKGNNKTYGEVIDLVFYDAR